MYKHVFSLPVIIWYQLLKKTLQTWTISLRDLALQFSCCAVWSRGCGLQLASISEISLAFSCSMEMAWPRSWGTCLISSGDIDVPWSRRLPLLDSSWSGKWRSIWAISMKPSFPTDMDRCSRPLFAVSNKSSAKSYFSRSGQSRSLTTTMALTLRDVRCAHGMKNRIKAPLITGIPAQWKATLYDPSASYKAPVKYIFKIQ